MLISSGEAFRMLKILGLFYEWTEMTEMNYLVNFKAVLNTSNCKTNQNCKCMMVLRLWPCVLAHLSSYHFGKLSHKMRCYVLPVIQHCDVLRVMKCKSYYLSAFESLKG